jgi:hypothetical protein
MSVCMLDCAAGAAGVLQRNHRNTFKKKKPLFKTNKKPTKIGTQACIALYPGQHNTIVLYTRLNQDSLVPKPLM